MPSSRLGGWLRSDATASVRDANKGAGDCVAEIAVRGSKEYTETIQRHETAMLSVAQPTQLCRSLGLQDKTIVIDHRLHINIRQVFV